MSRINEIDPRLCSIEELHSRKSLSDSIEKLEANIKLLEGNEMKDKYLLKVSDVLLEYYEESNTKSKIKQKAQNRSESVPNYGEIEKH